MTCKNYVENTLRKNKIVITVQAITYDDDFNSTLSDVILRLNDVENLPELPENLNNYYTWSGILIKQYLKKENYKGSHILTWLVGGVAKAKLLVDCDTNRDEDAMVLE